MNREDMIRMAREAGWQYAHGDSGYEPLWAFATLVAEHEREHYDKLFEQIKGWCDAYPISVFPEPDFKKAHEVLKANGMTLDSISASNMKHVITQVQRMIDDAILERKNTQQDTYCKHCTDGCPACDARKLPKEAHDLF